MKTKSILRLISLAMLVVAVGFVAVALSNPTLGTVFYIGNLRIGADIWRAFYLVYVIVMAALFAVSFCLKGERKKK